MPDSTQADDVARYAVAVGAALAALPEAERAILLEDLENHLAEVASESDVPLLDRLGKPEDYAAELKLAYGAGTDAASTRRRRPLRDKLRAFVNQGTGTQAYRELHALLPELRPGWWVLRAYLLVLVLAFIFRGGTNLRPIPNPFSSHGLLQIVATLAAIVISVRLGRRGLPAGKLWRGAAVAVNVAIALLALPVLVNMTTDHGYAYSTPESAGQYFSVEAGYYGPGVTNIYPYSQDGKPLKGILLYDQDGHPLMIQSQNPDLATDFPIGADGRQIANEYPLNQRHSNGDPILPPRVALPPAPTPTP